MGVRHPSPVAERLSDEWLARRAACGDDEAFAELERRYCQRLSRYAASLAGGRAAGERATSAALADARAALRRGFMPVFVRPWLYRITLNRVLASGEQRPAPAAASAAGTEREQRAVVLRQVRGLSVREIAAQLELTPREVERALFAARAPAGPRSPAPAAPARAPARPWARAAAAAAALSLVAAGGVLGPLAAREPEVAGRTSGLPPAAVAHGTADAEIAAVAAREGSRLAGSTPARSYAPSPR